MNIGYQRQGSPALPRARVQHDRSRHRDPERSRRQRGIASVEVRDTERRIVR